MADDISKVVTAWMSSDPLGYLEQIDRIGKYKPGGRMADITLAPPMPWREQFLYGVEDALSMLGVPKYTSEAEKQRRIEARQGLPKYTPNTILPEPK